MADSDSEEEDTQPSRVPAAPQLTFEAALTVLKASRQLPGTVTENEIIEAYTVISTANNVAVPLALMPNTTTAIVAAGGATSTGGAPNKPIGNANNLSQTSNNKIPTASTTIQYQLQQDLEDLLTKRCI